MPSGEYGLGFGVEPHLYVDNPAKPGACTRCQRPPQWEGHDNNVDWRVIKTQVASGTHLSEDDEVADDTRGYRVAQRYRTNGQAVVAGERQEQHGDPVRNMERFAELLEGYFGFKFSAHDACMIQILFKISRSKANPKLPDNYDDLEGYTEIARMCVRVESASSIDSADSGSAEGEPRRDPPGTVSPAR